MPEVEWPLRLPSSFLREVTSVQGKGKLAVQLHFCLSCMKMALSEEHRQLSSPCTSLPPSSWLLSSYFLFGHIPI